MLAADGRVVWLRDLVTVVAEGGTAIVLRGVMIDVTARREAEEAVRASEARCRTLLENLEQSIVLKDRDLRFVAANAPFCRGLGLTEADVIGKTDFDFYPPQ